MCVCVCVCVCFTGSDKCGAAAVAGFFQILAALRPRRVKAIGAMACVRNSIGAGEVKPKNK